MSVMQVPSSLDYDTIVEPHKRALKKLELDLDFFLRDVGQIDVFSVSSRIKTYRGAIAKSEQIGVSVQELDDLAGVRIVVGTSPEVPVVERFFTRQEDSKDLRILKREKITRKTGYRATHLVIELKGSYQSSMFPGRVEVQVHTIFEHAFNFLSRNWSYKQPWQLAPSWSSKFVRISELLFEIENVASELHGDVASALTNSESAPLTPHSLKHLIKSEFDEDLDICDCVDACRMYKDMGYQNNAQLRAFFRSHRIVELYEFVRTRSDGKSPKGPLSSMSKNSFWSLFGTRIDTPGLKQFFASLPADI